MSDPAWVYLIRPVRPGFMETATEAEDRVMGEHFAHLQRQLAEGRLVLAGPCLDAAFGIVVFHAPGEAEAAAMMRADPAVAAGLMTAELHPFRVSLLAGRR